MDGGAGTFRVGPEENDFDCSPELYALLSRGARREWRKMLREGKTVHGKLTEEEIDRRFSGKTKERKPPKKRNG